MLLHPKREMQTPIASNVWMASLLDILTAGQTTRKNLRHNDVLLTLETMSVNKNWQETHAKALGKHSFF